MKVKRLEVFDFEIELNQQEFAILKQASDETHLSISQIISRLLKKEIGRVQHTLNWKG